MPDVALGGAVPVSASDRSEELRQAAAECLRRARDTADDPGARVALLILARKSLDLADSLAARNRRVEPARSDPALPRCGLHQQMGSGNMTRTRIRWSDL